ncbi:MAG: ABC transporter ATP-binding protein [Candidatus Marinimicrobia bacterium]|nr:ABC transporter ATP-binding protein [Candidatus Neomarinimicrobiota bacterium]
MNVPLVKIKHVSVDLLPNGDPFTVLDNITLNIIQGEVMGLIGETGCGKSMTAWLLLDLLPGNGKIKSGSIWFRGQDVTGSKRASLRGKNIAMIFQDPSRALNPVHRIGKQFMAILNKRYSFDNQQTRKLALEWIERVRLDSPEEVFQRYPHQFSGGQMQRLMIAIAMSLKPDLLIADEPTTALDASLKSYTLDMIDELRKEFNISVLLISHNLKLMGNRCDRIAVMYNGAIVENADADHILHKPKHPYTKGLINALPTGENKRLIPIEGSPPSRNIQQSGCRFEPRCADAIAICKSITPQLFKDSNGSQVLCHHFSEENKLPQ